MKIAFALGVGLAALIATPALATVTFTVSSITDVGGVLSNNDMGPGLAGLGLTRQTVKYSDITLSAPSRIEFLYVGSESGYNNGLHFGASTYVETNASFSTALSRILGQSGVVSGSIADDFYFDSNGSGSYTVKSGGIAVFLPSSYKLPEQGEGSYTANTLYLGLDDFTGNPDKDYDDYVIRIGAVPEPATWAMMIAGFGLVGGAMRRSAKPRVAVAYS